MPLSRWDAVIFDYGRVLSLAPSDAELQDFAALVGVTEPPFFQIYSATRHNYDCGRCDFRQHWQAFADAAGVKLRRAQVERIAGMETLMWLRVNPEMLALAREIKAQGMRTRDPLQHPSRLAGRGAQVRLARRIRVEDLVVRVGHREAQSGYLPRLSRRFWLRCQTLALLR